MSENEMYLEHANITVGNIEETVEFFKTAFPEFRVRGHGESTIDGVTRRWLHFGTDVTYIALESVTSKDEGSRRAYKDVGINHLGFVVRNVDEITANLTAAGYKQSIDVEPHPFRKRVYFYDKSGIEYEFTQYLSDKPIERNDYDL